MTTLRELVELASQIYDSMEYGRWFDPTQRFVNGYFLKPLFNTEVHVRSVKTPAFSLLLQNDDANLAAKAIEFETSDIVKNSDVRLKNIAAIIAHCAKAELKQESYEQAQQELETLTPTYLKLFSRVANHSALTKNALAFTIELLRNENARLKSELTNKDKKITDLQKFFRTTKTDFEGAKADNIALHKQIHEEAVNREKEELKKSVQWPTPWQALSQSKLYSGNAANTSGASSTMATTNEAASSGAGVIRRRYHP
jgi:hypothetical protein